jgi:hypothetical protein
MEVVKEEDIAIICTLSHYQNHSKDNYSNKCTSNIPNFVKKREIKVNKTTSEDSEDKIIEEETDKEKKDDQGQDLKKKEEWKKREAEDLILQSREILHWIVSL